MIVSLEALNQALADKLEQLLPELVGGAPDHTRREWIAAHRAAGGPGDSLMVRLAGDKRGRWVWHAEGKGGDPLGLICELRTGGDMKAAFRWARDWLGGDIAIDPDIAARQRRIAAERAAREDKRRREAKTGFARDIWREGRPLAATPADLYLRGRGLHLDRLPHYPPSLRYHPKLLHPALARELPALIAAVQDNTGAIVAVHRTFLVAREGGRWDRVREDLDEAKGKLVLGPIRGASIHIWNGEHVSGDGEIVIGRSWSGARGMTSVTCTEGIEDALTLALGNPRQVLLAVVAIGNFASLVLPAQCRHVIWCKDNDPKWSPTVSALATAIRAHTGAGRHLEIFRPPRGRKDVNDLLLRGRPRQTR